MKRNFLLLLVLTQFLFSCKEETAIVVPAPEFTVYEYYAVHEPVLVKDVTKAEHYLWDFGNGITSTDKFPHTWVYTEPGIYTIRLTTYTQGQKSTTEKQLKIGQYYAYEAQLLSYYENYELEGGDMSGPSEGNPDVYLQISHYINDAEEVLYKSEVRPGVTKEDLPLSWSFYPIALGGSAVLPPYFSPFFRFYDSNADKADRLIAHNLVTGGSSHLQFDKEKNEGQYSQKRGGDDWGSHVVVKFKMKFP
ncbi:hypothetical protein DXT99_05005 [Pontibacter diazotrophicus]|uniref:PKD domain-containing protein n=1 Tax=Pontibacter diazotrophicus TaxID=1400979 RepID=A0A3D8LH40_9BACT|nr:PKD domain-containing protein [Pontibacter diazotrophicus]RDV16554.1 hypothetical protein DXT99_05005 [Pontibacter diazotrophicus]